MAKQVENRVVEMEFKNKDFEKAVAVTLDSIEKLNTKLDELNKVNTSGFENITKAANKIDFSKAASSLDELASRFTTITGKIKSQIQDWVIEDIIKKPLQQLEQVADTVYGTIVDKGKTRAKNLAQAKFQLEALGVAWEQVYDDMDYAVTGTAYGIDEAALAASQFAASNVQLGDDMKAALRGISGVAAMTGRSYSEIAQIFTKVAGAGKAMTMELNQISYRGLSAKKAIADYINDFELLGKGIKVTQEDIAEMASDSEISFDIFSKAMDYAFGEHSTKANELFTGALDNTKAALGRIGERFATPIYEDLRQVLVSLIPVINDFKKSLDPIVNSVSSITAGIRTLIVDVLTDIHGSFDKENHYLLNWFGEEVDVQEKLLNLLNTIGKAADGIGASFENGLASTAGDIFLNVLYNIVEVIKAIKDGIKEVFDAPTVYDVLNFIDSLKKLSDKMVISEKTTNRLKRIVAGLAAAFDIVGKTVKNVWDVVISPILEDIGIVLGDTVLESLAKIGDKLVNFDKNYSPWENIYNGMQKVWPILFRINRHIESLYMTFKENYIPHIEKFFVSLKESLNKFKESLSKLVGINDVQSFFIKMDELAQNLHIADIFYGIAGAILYAFDQLTAFIDLLSGSTEFKEYLQSIKESSIILSWISEKIEAIKLTWQGLWAGNITLTQALGLDKLAEKFGWLQVIIDKFKEHYGSIFTVDGEHLDPDGVIKPWSERLKKALLEMDFQEVFSMIATGFYTYFAIELKKHQKQLVDSLTGVADNLKGITKKINEALTGATEGVQENKLLSIGKGIALLAGSIFLLALIPESDLDKALGAVMTLMITLGVIFGILGLIFKKYELMQSSAEDAGVLLLEDKSGGKKGLGGFFSRLGGGIGSICDGIKASLTDLAKAPAMMVAFGAAIFMLASAIYRLKDVDPGQLIIATLAIVTLMATMGILLTKMRTPDTTKLAGVFLSMGVAVGIMMGTILLIALLPADKMFQAVAAMGMVMFLLYGMAAVLTFLSTEATINPASILAGAGAMMMMAAAMQMIIIPVTILTELLAHTEGLEVIDAIGSVMLMMLGMAGFALAFGLLGGTLVGAVPGMLAAGGAMMMMAAALGMMMIPVAGIMSLAAIDVEALIASVQIITILTVVMSLMLVLFGVIGSMSVGMGSFGMLAGAAAMLQLSLALSALLIPLAGMAALQASGQFEAAFVALANSLMLLALAAAVAIPLAPGLTALTTVVVGCAAAVFLIGAAVYAAGAGVFYFVSALGMLALFDWQTLANNIAANGTVIKQAILTLIGGALEALIECTDMAVEAAVIMLVDVCKGIDKRAAEIGYHLGHAIMDIISYAFAGILAGAGDLAMNLLGAIFGFDTSDAKFSSFIYDKFFGKDGGKKASDEAAGGFFNNLKDSLSGAFKSDELVETVDGNSIGQKAGEGASKGFETSFLGGIQGMSAGAGSDYADEFYKEFDQGMNSPTSMSQIQETMNKFSAGAGSALENDSTIPDAIENTYKGALGEGNTALDIKNGYSLESYKQWEMVDLGGAKGLLANNYTVDAMKQLDNNVLNTHLTDWKQHSPSKVMIESGKYIDEGLAIGLTESNASESAIDQKSRGLIAMFTSIGDAVTGSVETNAMTDLSDAIASIADEASGSAEFNPTITPVLDLSNVNQGFSTLNSLFSAQRSMQLAGGASYLNDAGRSLTMEIQNNNKNGTNNSINSLGSKLDRLGETILNRQIVLDSGELVGGLVDPMDRTLGVRAIRAQRGGAR